MNSYTIICKKTLSFTLRNALQTSSNFTFKNLYKPSNFNHLKISALPHAFSTSSAVHTPEADQPQQQLTSRRVNSSLSLYEAPADSALPRARRPLVLLYAWLGARDKHLAKFAQLYARRGFDTACVRLRPSHIAWPRRINADKALAACILDFLLEQTDPPASETTALQCKNMSDEVSAQDSSGRPILVHGFSVGGYLYGETVFKLIESAHKYGPLAARLKGQVFDSPVDCVNVPFGLAYAMAPHSAARRRLIEQSMHAFMRIAYNQCTRYYLRSSFIFHHNPLRTPSLMFYSRSDPVGTADRIEMVYNTWSRGGIPVYFRRWDDTKHVMHYSAYPDEYESSLDMFLWKVGLGPEPASGCEVNSADQGQVRSQGQPCGSTHASPVSVKSTSA